MIVAGVAIALLMIVGMVLTAKGYKRQVVIADTLVMIPLFIYFILSWFGITPWPAL